MDDQGEGGDREVLLDHLVLAFLFVLVKIKHPRRVHTFVCHVCWIFFAVAMRVDID